LALLVIRSSVSGLIITVLSEYPIIQTIALVIIDGVMIVLLFRLKPFASLQAKLAQYYFEAITLFVHICAFFLSIQGKEGNPDDAFRKIFSSAIIYANTILVAGALGFMFIELFMMIREKTEASSSQKTLSRSPSQSIAIQTSANKNSEAQHISFRTETANLITHGNYVPRKHNQIHPDQSSAGIENFHLLSVLDQSNLSLARMNLQSDQFLHENSNAENSQINVSNVIHHQMENSAAQILVRHKRKYHIKKRNFSQINQE